MKWHKAQTLFKQKPWLESAIYDVSGGLSGRKDFVNHVTRGIYSICFYDFENFILEAKSAYGFHDLGFGYGIASTEVRLSVSYAVIWNNQGETREFPGYKFLGRPDTCSCDTVLQTIEKITKEHPGQKLRFEAILCKKLITSTFGGLLAYDVFEFPEGWLPPSS